MPVEQIYAMFPNLKERASQGTRLSGGEQQMLAVARILRTGAKLPLLDEISEGLCAGDRAEARRDGGGAQAGLHHRDGGAELPLRRPAGRPLLVMEHGRSSREFTQSELPADGQARLPRRLNVRKSRVLAL